MQFDSVQLETFDCDEPGCRERAASKLA